MRRGQPSSPENSTQWNFLMLSIFHSRPIAAGRGLRSDAHARAVDSPAPQAFGQGGLRQLLVLTTVAPPEEDGPAGVLPEPIRNAIVEGGASALRAWRNYCGISMRTLQLRTDTSSATLQAIDRGDVTICEWTVGALAKALHVEAWQLLEAQALASRQGRARVSSEKYAGFAK